MSTLELQAPAKINLSLRVLAKRPDGFHDIDSTFVQIPGLADRITFTPAKSFSFTCDDPTLPTDDSNLVVRAVRAYESASTNPSKVTIHLAKSIPHGAGLGGGSSDAATTLLGLEQMNESKLGSERLKEIAASLGADVPFFLHGKAARCRGRGERVEPVACPPPLRVLLLKPAFQVSAAEAYSLWQDSRELPHVCYAEQDLEGTVLVNDLERPVFSKHRFLAELKIWLLARDEVAAALLCGSGSTVLAVLHSAADANALAGSARHEIDPGLWSWSGPTAS